MPYIVIDENGEIVEELCGRRIVALNDGDRVVRKRSIEHYKKRLAENNKPSKARSYTNVLADKFTMINIDELKLLIGALDVSEKAFLLSISPYVGYGDCCIKKGDGTSLNVKDIMDASNMSRSRVYEIIASLIDKNVLYKDKRGYFVNPWLFYRGSKINGELKDMFGNYEIRCEDMVRWKDT